MTRRGLRVLVGGVPEFEVCGECTSLADGLAMVASHRPSITLVDLALRDEDALAGVRALRERHPAGRVLVFSSLDERFFAPAALQAGASREVLPAPMGARRDGPTVWSAASARGAAQAHPSARR